MIFTRSQLRRIYDRSTGYCHICHKKLAFSNYGACGSRGAWEVEHSRPHAKGGTDRLTNLYAACISCNRSKGKHVTRTARAKHGKTRAPLSAKKRKSTRAENAVLAGLAGAAIGAIFGPAGAVAGAAVGAHLGHKKNPDK